MKKIHFKRCSLKNTPAALILAILKYIISLEALFKNTYGYSCQTLHFTYGKNNCLKHTTHYSCNILVAAVGGTPL